MIESMWLVYYRVFEEIWALYINTKIKFQRKPPLIYSPLLSFSFFHLLTSLFLFLVIATVASNFAKITPDLTLQRDLLRKLQVYVAADSNKNNDWIYIKFAVAESFSRGSSLKCI